MLKSYLDKLYIWLGTASARKWIFGFFIVQVVYLIFYMRIGVPPDELTHIRFIEHYADNSLNPLIQEQTNDFFLGDVTREISFIYHYVLSLVYRILPVPVLAKYLIFRIIGLAMSIVTLIYGLKIARLLGIDSKLSNLSLFIVTNASEWMLMSAAVNNDNAVWMLSSIGIYLVLKLWQEPPSLQVSLGLVLVLLIGSITKKTFLPIGFVLLAALAVLVWSKRKQFKSLIQKAKPAQALLIVPILFFAVLVGERIGGNLITYQSLEARCDEIHSVEQCSEFGVFRRNYRLANERSEVDTSLLEYAPFWVFKNTARVFGPQAWTGDEPPDDWFTVTLIGFSVLGFVGIVSAYLKKQRSKNANQLMFVLLLSVGYVVVNFFVNYGIYQQFSVMGLALQGRYIFPVLMPLITCLVVGIFASRIMKRFKPYHSIMVVLFCFVLLWQSGISRILTTNKYVVDKLEPVTLFEPSEAIGPWEPSI